MAAGIVFTLQSLAWPVFEGRDGRSYLLYYADLLNPDPVYRMLMLYRTPGTPIFFGVPLNWGGALAVEILLGVCFCITILAIYQVGSHWSRFVGLAAAFAVLLHPAYGALFHSISSEAPFAFLFILWIWFIFRTARQETPATFAVHAVILFGLVMIRPSSLVFLAFVIFPLALSPRRLRQQAISCVVFLGTGLSLLLLYAAYNYTLYGDFTVSRGGGAIMPLYRLFTKDHLVNPGNGAYSAKLAEAVESDLLPEEPYRSYEITLKQFFQGGPRYWADLVNLSDRTWGWDSDYQALRGVALEAMAHNPIKYGRAVLLDTAAVFIRNAPAPAPIRREVQLSSPADIPRNEKGLPLPSEGQAIPLSRIWWLASTPDSRFEYDFAHYYRTGEITLLDKAMQKRVDEISARVQRFLLQLPPRDGLPVAAAILSGLASVFPPMILWLLLGCAGLAPLLRRERLPGQVLLFMIGLAILLLGATALGVDMIYAYRLPFDPLFILFGMASAEAMLKSKD